MTVRGYDCLYLVTCMLAAALVAGLVGPGSAQAQDLTVDKAVVQACFKSITEDGTERDCIGKAGVACEDLPGGATTNGTAVCIGAESAVWDEIRHEQFAAQKNAVTEDGEGVVKALEASESAWEGFRKAECDLQYKVFQQGTIRSVVASWCDLRLTADRAIALNRLGSLE